jgi:hypothetical protein
MMADAVLAPERPAVARGVRVRAPRASSRCA